MARPRTFDRDKILAAARNLFWEKGFAATSINDLEQVTGLKRTSIYAAFGNKESLYQEALRDYQKISHVVFDRCFEQEENPLLRIRCVLETSIKNSIEDVNRKGCFIGNATSERAHQCPKTTALIISNKSKVIEKYKSQLDLAKTEKFISAQANTTYLAAYLFTLQSGLMASLKAGMTEKELLNILDLGMRVVAAA